MKKQLRYILWIFVILLVLFLSFDIRKLDEYKSEDTTVIFNAEEYAAAVWENKLPQVIQDAPEINMLTGILEDNAQQAFEQYGRKLGISRTWYFFARGEGIVESVEDEFLRVNTGGEQPVNIATAFIFGNAVRDGSGVVDIDDFVNMTDFNNVSVALNDHVREDVVARFKAKAEPGMKIEFAGAFEVKEDQTGTNSIQIIPVSVKLSSQ